MMRFFLNLQTTQRQSLVTGTLSETSFKSKTIDKIRIPDEELEKLDGRIKEQIQRDPDGSYRCRMCGKIAPNMWKMKNHIETHFEGLSFPCSICPSKLSTRHSLRMHYSRMHGGMAVLLN